MRCVTFVVTLLLSVSISLAQDKPATTQAANYGKEKHRLVNQSDEIISVLENGATVIAKRVPSPVMAVRGYVFTGGIYEGKWLGGGLSHLLEHLVAGGSSKNRTEAQNRDLLQRIGNNSNAYTSSDHTAYFVNTTPPHMEEAVDLVAGWMLGALITPEEYRREYEVVQRELEKDKGEPDYVFYLLSLANRYRISPARVPTIGYQEVIQKLSRDDVYDYYKLAYQPNNMVFSVAGDLDPQKMLEVVQKHVGAEPHGREFSHDIAAEPPVQAPRTAVATFPKLGQANVELAFPSITLHDPDLFALDLLSTILGGGESSIFVEALRDKRIVNGVSVSSFTPDYAEGSFQIDMTLDPAKVAEATDAALKLVDSIVKEPISEDRIARAKVQMRTSRVKSQQTAESIAASMATDFLSTGDPHFSDRYVKAIQEVTAADLQRVARKYLDRSRLLTTTLLPSEFVGAGGLPKAEDIIRAAAPTTRETATEGKTKVTRVELGNGTILLHKRIATSPLIVMNMYALGGLTTEDAKTNGIGNLAMRTLERGTEKRTAEQIAQFFDSVGGDFSASCGNNSWYWNAQCMKEDFEKTFDVYADIVSNPKFPDDQTAAMKQRVLAQIESQDADWTQQAMRFFKAKYFGPMNSPYQFLPIGTAETVSSFKPEQLKQWYTDQVLKAPRVLAVYGDVSLEKAQSLAEATIGKLPKVSAPAKREIPPPKIEAKSEIAHIEVERVELNKTEQPLAGVIIGFHSDSLIGDPANAPIDVADTMCSGFGYPTGYLHEILRGQGLVYVVHAQNWPGKDEKLAGNFFIYAGCDPGNANKVVDIILENIARLQGTEQDLQPGWFERSKQLITTSDAMDNETPAEQATQAALDELYGLGFDYHDGYPKRIDAVKLDDVRGIAQMRLRKCIVTVSTPAPDIVKVETGERRYEKFPPVDLTPRGVQHDAK